MWFKELSDQGCSYKGMLPNNLTSIKITAEMTPPLRLTNFSFLRIDIPPYIQHKIKADHFNVISLKTQINITKP